MQYILFTIFILFSIFTSTGDNRKITFVLPDNERVGQLFIIGFDGTEVTPEFAGTLREYRPGGVLLLGRNINDAKQLTRLTHDLQTIATEEGRPPLWIAVDQEGGIVSRIKWTKYPEPLAALDEISASRLGRARAQELHKLGVNMNLAPVLDSRDPHDSLYSRALHQPSELAIIVATHIINTHAAYGVLAVPKHFPGYDTIRINPELTVVPVVPNAPDTTFFQRVINATQSPIVMASHVIYKDMDAELPFPLSSAGIQFFKKELGDDILFMSDDLLSPAFQKEYSVPELAEKSAASGLDLYLLGDPKGAVAFMTQMRELVKGDLILTERISRTAARILEIKK